MIFYFILEYIAVTTLMLVSFVLFKAIIRKPVSAQSLKIVLNASAIAFFISILILQTGCFKEFYEQRGI